MTSYWFEYNVNTVTCKPKGLVSTDIYMYIYRCFVNLNILYITEKITFLME